MKIETSTFDTIEIGPDAPYLKTPLTVNGRTSDCGLYIADEIAQHPAQAAKVKEMIDNIAWFDKRAREILLQGLQDGNSTIIDFIDFHLEEVAAEIKEKLGVTEVDQHIFMHGLDLKALGFHLHDDGIQLCCDYSIGEDFVDELLVVKFDANGKLIQIAHES